MKLTSWLSSLKSGVTRALRTKRVKKRVQVPVSRMIREEAETLEDRTVLNAVLYNTGAPDGIYDADALQVPPNNPSIPYPIITIRVYFQGNVSVTGDLSFRPRLYLNTYSQAGDPNDPNFPGFVGQAIYQGPNVVNAPFLDFEYNVNNGENTPGPLQPVPELTVIGGTSGSPSITDGGGTVDLSILPAFGSSEDGQIVDLSSGLDKFIYIDTRPVMYGLAVDSTTPDSLPTNLDPSQGAIRRPYRVGDAPILITVTYTEPVAVTGTPVIWLNTNGLDGIQVGAVGANPPDRQAVYISGSGTNVLTFQYIIQEGDNTLDLDYTGFDALRLPTSGDQIKDQDFQQQDSINNLAGASIAFPGWLGQNRAIQVDTRAPAVGTSPGVTIEQADGVYGVGQQLTIRISFDEAIFLTGSPTLTLATGGVNRVATFGGFDGTDTLLFTYVVQKGDISLDLDYVNANSLSLNGGSLTDVAGNNANITLPTPGLTGSLSFNKNIVIDTDATVTNITSPVTNGNYGIGQVIPIQVVFNKPVTVFGIPQLILDLDLPTDSVVVNYSSGSGSNVLVFNYTIQAGHNTLDLDYITTPNALILNGGSIIDTASNGVVDITMPAVGGPGSLGFNKNIKIDTTLPVLVSVTAANSSPDGTYVVGQQIPIQVRFSEAVSVTGTPQITLDTNGIPGVQPSLLPGQTADWVINYSSGSGTDTLTFLYTVQSGHTSTDLDALLLSLVNNSRIQDIAQNNLAATGTILNLPTLNSEIMTNTTAVPNRTAVSQVTDVFVSSATPGQTYQFTAGGTTATYVALPGDTQQTIAVALRNQFAGSPTISAVSIGNLIRLTALNAGTPFTVAGMTNVTTPGTNVQDNLTAIAQRTDVTIVSVAPGDVFTLTLNGVTFTHTAIAGNTPNSVAATFRAFINAHATVSSAVTATGAGSQVIVTSDNPGTAFTLSTGYSLAGNRNLVIDTAPIVTNVTSSTPNGTYVTGQAIQITIQFNEPVNVTGTPLLQLETNGVDGFSGDAVAIYNSGSGTNTLVFLYSIGAGESTVDLSYINTLSLLLNGGTITDIDGATATAILTLPAVGAAGSLSFNKDLQIDDNVNNDAPVNFVPGTQTTTEDVVGGVVFSAANGNQILIKDVDVGAGQMTVTLTGEYGTITVPATMGLTITNNGTASVTLDGDLATINAGLNGLVFQPVANVNSSTTNGIRLTITTSDLGNTGAGGIKTDSDFIAINVIAVNDAPTAGSFSSSGPVGTSQTINLQGLDTENSTLTYTITSQPQHGTVTITPGTGIVTYTPTAGYVGPDSFTYIANDGSLPSNVGTVSISVLPQLAIGGAPDYSNTEGDAGNKIFSIPVTLSHPAVGTVSLNWQTVQGDALNNLDFIPSGVQTLTFLNGQQTAYIEVFVVGDLNDENDETFAIQLSNGVGVFLADTQINVNILNDDGISVSDVNQIETNSGQTAFVFRIFLSQPSASTVTVSYQTADGTASSITDYQATAGSVTFLPGETEKFVTVMVNGDGFHEQNELFYLNLLSPSGANLAKSQGVGTIINDDVTPSLTIGDITVNEGQSGVTNFVFTINLTAVSGQTVTVDYATANGTAAAGTDYLSQTGTVSFAPGVTSQQVTVSVLGDQLLEADETFFLNLTNALGATLSDNQGTAIIANDDGLRITDAQISEGNVGTKLLTFTVTAPQTGGPTITVDFATVGGTATQGVDFNAVVGTLSFPVGVTSRTISVPIVGDYFTETNESFQVVLSNSVNAPLINAVGTGLIIDDDVTPTITITNQSITEANSGATNMTFTVNLSQATGIPVTVDFATFDQTTTAGSDYVPTSGTITFPAFNTTQQITVSILGDLIDEANETFFVALSNPTNAILDMNTIGIGTILDNDAMPTMSVQNISFNEGQAGSTTATFMVSLSQPSGQSVTVNYTTVDGTATVADGDYTTATGSLTFLPGEVTKLITVSVNGDAFYENTETFALNLSGAVNASLSSGSQAIATIQNDDPKPTIVVSDATEFEGNAGTVGMVFTFTLLQPSKLPATVTYNTSSGTALDGNDYQTAVGTITFLPGETTHTVTVLVNGDQTVEADETFLLNLSGETNAVVSDRIGVGTIRNDDVTPSITINDVSLTEGDSGFSNMVFTVTVANPNGQPISVQYSTSNGNATAGNDFTAQSGTLVFAGNETTKTISVPIRGDLTAESTEQFFVNLSNPSNATLSDIQGVGTILNDDNNPPVVSVPVGPFAGVEDQNVALTGLGVSDIDAGNALISLTITANNGTLQIRTDVFNGVTPGDVTLNGTDSVTLTGTVTQINNTLANPTGVVYHGNLNFAGTDSITLVANDLGNSGSGGARTDVKTVQVVLTDVNDDPAILLSGTPTTSVRGNQVAIDNGVTFSDPDNQTNYGNAVITATNAGALGFFIGSKDVLSVRNQGKGSGQIGFKKGKITYGGVEIGVATGGKANIPLQITLNNKASAAAVEALLRNITFETAKAKKQLVAQPRGIQFTMTDGRGGTSTTVTKAVNVTL